MSDFELPKESVTKPRKGATTVAEMKSEVPNPEVGKETKAETETKPRWNQDELLAVFDEIIFSGTYSEEVVIRNKLRLRLRTRSAEEVETITNTLDGTGANLVATVNEKRSLMNIYYALTWYQGKDLSTLKQSDRESFVNKLPAPIVGAIITAMAKFDQKVWAACAEGEENF